jgi:membrane fusion protein (multidrug efflux system)
LLLIIGVFPGLFQSVSQTQHDRVAAGQVLFALNAEPFAIALRQAEAGLTQALTDVAADKIAYRGVLAEIELQQSSVLFASAQYDRQRELRRANLGTVEDLDGTQHALDSARKRVDVLRQEAQRLLVKLGGDADIDPRQHPQYLQAQAQREQAQLDMLRTTVRAPFAGVATNAPDLGEYVEGGRAVMAVVASDNKWIEANFKETDLTHIVAGQAVTVEVDTYPGRQWHGSVQSISEATGAEFALLPPQNATGNWVKIVQRIPVKVVLDSQPDGPVLRVGMSCTVSVDTHHVRTWRDLLPNW